VSVTVQKVRNCSVWRVVAQTHLDRAAVRSNPVSPPVRRAGHGRDPRQGHEPCASRPPS